MIVQKWVRIAFLNLLVVAFIGVLLRYKIVYSLPFIDQKHLLHGHSHFAFFGWVSQILMTLIIQTLSDQKKEGLFKKYRWLLYCNLVASYGMLVGFSIQGYGVYSIGFSTFSIVIFCVFAAYVWKDINAIPQKQICHLWFKAAVIWNIVSSLGTFALAFMMVNKVIHQNWYLAAVYFFLHFQYNGWFVFSCMGLLFYQLHKSGIIYKSSYRFFWLFAISCIPAYFLSVLWLKIPTWMYILVVTAAFAQVVAWVMFIKKIQRVKTLFFHSAKKVDVWLLSLSALAFTIKLLLQLGSTIPSLSTLAFGFRSIVVGYLHLVFLGVVSLFIIGYCFLTKYFRFNRINAKGALIFAGGVIVNELLLLFQSVAAINYVVIPYINEALLASALILLLGLIVLNVPLKSSK